ncbi:MAG: sugar transferase [Arcobacteraceae bacterium]
MQYIKTNTANFFYTAILIMMDAFVLFISYQIAYNIRKNIFIENFPIFTLSNIDKYYWIILIILIILIVEKIYFIRYDFWSDTKRVLKALTITFLTVFTVISLTKMSDEYSRTFILLFFFISAFLIPFVKRVLKRFLFRFDFFKLRVKIIANSNQYDVLYEEINSNWYFGFFPCNNKYDMVLISSKNFEIEELHKIIRRYSKKTKDIYVIPYLYYLDFMDMSMVNYFNIRLSAIYIENKLLNKKNIFIKFIFEKLLVLCIFPFALLLHLFLTILIKYDSKGSVLFKQKRLGEKKQIFSCYKYRTMYENGEQILKKYLKENPAEIEHYQIYHKYKNDPRITKIGKYLRASSLDEFPQFYNILRGDMNLIGPRPYMLNESDKIGKYNEDTILKVKPGLTGFWQVSGRNKLTFQDRIELDIWYIQNWSLWIDFVIFMKTIKVVLSKIGAK